MTHSWIVDVLDTHTASVEVDGGTMVTIPRWMLPAAAKEGHVLRVTHDRPAKGERSVLTIEIDAEATRRAMAQSAEQMARARTQAKNDPGGDIAL